MVLNVTYWTIYEKFHEMVLQIKTIDKIDKAKSQPISDEGQDAVVASDIVDVHGENFGRSPTSNTSVRKGKSYLRAERDKKIIRIDEGELCQGNETND